jgi:hypothetical protein
MSRIASRMLFEPFHLYITRPVEPHRKITIDAAIIRSRCSSGRKPRQVEATSKSSEHAANCLQAAVCFGIRL